MYIIPPYLIWSSSCKFPINDQKWRHTPVKNPVTWPYKVGGGLMNGRGFSTWYTMMNWPVTWMLIRPVSVFPSEVYALHEYSPVSARVAPPIVRSARIQRSSYVTDDVASTLWRTRRYSCTNPESWSPPRWSSRSVGSVHPPSHPLCRISQQHLS